MHPNPEVRKLQSVVDDLLCQRRDLTVLEAGCGAYRHITYRGPASITGIDLSTDQLGRNEALNRKIAGDIQDYPFSPGTFDVVVCWDVLEHLPRPEAALLNLMAALRSGGLLIIGVPNVRSMKGLLTKFTPFAFHVWFHRHVFKNQDAGTPGRNPFPTFLRLSISPDSIARLGRLRGLSVVYCHLYENDTQVSLRSRLRLTGDIWRVLSRAVAITGRGMVSLDETECHIVMRKEQAVGHKN